MNEVRDSYDAIAQAYADHFFHELERKPLDRALLDLFAAEVRGKGKVIDLGCGPGQVARYLSERGVVETCGIDLSPKSIEVARTLSPSIEFVAGSMLALELSDSSVAGIASFYAIVNLSREQVLPALREMRRVLHPGAPLLLTFHLGEESLHVEEMFGGKVALDFHFFSRAFIEPALGVAGLSVESWTERKPYPEEHPSTRAYVFARPVVAGK